MGRLDGVTRPLAVIGGAALLLWPAILNGYPILFSDTGGLLSQGLEPEIGWDKPWAYGPFLLASCARATLWIPVWVQALIVSHVLWLVQKTIGSAIPGRHLAVCAALAIGTAASWFTSLLMPDAFAPMVVLCLFLLAFHDRLSRIEQGWIVLVASFAIAVHLAHLVVAAALIAAVLLLRWRQAALCAVPLVLALGLSLAANWVGNGVVAVSPFGSIFALARLQADGPAADYLKAACPDMNDRFCSWVDRMPMDSDRFLWDPDGPIWADESGPTLLAARAASIVRETLRTYPLESARAASGNTLRQLGMVQVGDAFGPDYLDSTVLPRLQKYLPARETAAFADSLQETGALAKVARRFSALHVSLLAFGSIGTLVVLVRSWRDRVARGFALMVFAGLLANAFATGALSGPHDRYQARIAWLILLPPILAIKRERRCALAR